MTDVTVASADNAPDDSLRAALNAAVTANEGAGLGEKADAPAPAVDAKAPPAEEPTTDGRKRGPDGKFIKAEGSDAEPDKPEPEPAADPAAIAAAPEAKPEPDKPPAAPATTEPPVTLAREHKEKFKALPPEAQTIVADLIKRQEADYTRKTQAIAGLKSEYEPVEQMFAPYREQMRAKGLSPRSLIEGWANVEKRLVDGDGVSIVAGLVNGYNIDRAAVARALGLTAPQPGAGQDQQQPAEGQPAQPIQLPPELIAELRDLRGKVNAQEQHHHRSVRAAQESAEARVMTEIESFKSAKDGSGTLLHPHFADVEDDMLVIATGYRARGLEPPPIDDLYERAVHSNRSTRDQLFAAQRQAEEQRKANEARAKAAAARKASASVTGAPGPGQSPTQKGPDRSLRDELLAAADDAA